MKAFIRHANKLRFCHKGVRSFFILQGWDYQDFVKNGIDVILLNATGDAMARKLAKKAEEEEL